MPENVFKASTYTYHTYFLHPFPLGDETRQDKTWWHLLVYDVVMKHFLFKDQNRNMAMKKC